MGNPILSRRALMACLAVACAAATARADALVKPADPTTIVATPQAQPAAAAATVHEDSLAAPAATPLTPRAVAARQAQRAAAAASTKPPWYSLSRLKGLLPSLTTMESWIPGFKRNPVTVRTVPRDTATAAKTTAPTIQPLAASQQARITRAAASTVHVPQGELIAPVPAPEPSTWMILALGGAGGWYWRSRRARR